MNRWLKRIVICAGAMSLCLVRRQSVFAANCGGVETGILECDGGGTSGIWTTIELVINILSVMIGVVAVIGIVFFGIQLLTSNGDAAKSTKAKRRMFEVIIGLVIYVLLWSLAQWLLPGGTFGRPDDIESIKLNLSKEKADIGDTVSTTVTFTPEDVIDKTYSLKSDNEKIASIDGYNVRCEKAGQVKITAFSINDKQASATIVCGEGETEKPADNTYDGSLGVAGSLAAKTAVVTIFLNEENCYLNSSWGDSAKGTVTKRLGKAMNWIEKEMSGVSTFGLNYSTSNGDLSKTITKTSGTCISDSGYSGAGYAIDPIIRLLNEYYPLTSAECNGRSNCTSMESLKKKYGVQNVAFMVLIDSQPMNGASAYTYAHNPLMGEYYGPTNKAITGRDMTNYGYEYSVIFAGDESGSEDYETIGYAHELIHQFGAPDLYGTTDVGSMSKIVPVNYFSAEKADKDIMGSAMTEVPMNDLKMTAITKYYTGVSSVTPAEAGFGQYGTWAESQHKY